MDNAYKRKKQPQAVRAQILKAAAQVVVECGLNGLTLDRVAQKAGVSKGGLMHHFPNKQDLVDRLFDILLSAFEKVCGERMAGDPDPHGMFTRAYVTAIVDQADAPPDAKLFGACGLALVRDAALAIAWRDWVQAQVVKHGEPGDSALGRIVRYAADGIWLEDAAGVSSIPAPEREEMFGHLVRLSHEIGK